MKKTLSLVLAVLMLVLTATAFVSCTGSKTTTEGSNPTESTTPTVAPTDTEKQVLKMGTNAYFQPYEFYDDQTIVGIDAEIAAAIAEKLGMTLEISDMEFDSLLTAVNAGEIDFAMAGMTVTKDRLKEVDFSTSYANGVQVIIVKEGSAITNADDLAADGATYKIGTQLGTTGDIYAGEDFGEDESGNDNGRVVSFANGNEAVLALVGGSVDCVIIDNEPAKALVAANSGLKILETEYANEDYAIAVKKGDTELLNKINGAIAELVADGTIDKIIGKYIPAEG